MEGQPQRPLLALLRALWCHCGAVELLSPQQPGLGQGKVREVDVVRPAKLCCGIPWQQVVPQVPGIASKVKDGQSLVILPPWTEPQCRQQHSAELWHNTAAGDPQGIWRCVFIVFNPARSALTGSAFQLYGSACLQPVPCGAHLVWLVARSSPVRKTYSLGSTRHCPLYRSFMTSMSKPPAPRHARASCQPAVRTRLRNTLPAVMPMRR